MTYLGIDFGQRTGVCSLSGGLVFVETWDLPKGPENEGLRYGWFRNRLTGEIDPSTRVVFEDPAFHRGGPAGKQSAGYRAILMLTCEEMGVSYASVPVATLKAFARERTGLPCKGKLIDAAHAHAATEGHELGEIDDNAADAYWLAIYGRDALSW
jgi:hypothetical protein